MGVYHFFLSRVSVDGWLGWLLFLVFVNVHLYIDIYSICRYTVGYICCYKHMYMYKNICFIKIYISHSRVAKEAWSIAFCSTSWWGHTIQHQLSHRMNDVYYTTFTPPFCWHEPLLWPPSHVDNLLFFLLNIFVYYNYMYICVVLSILLCFSGQSYTITSLWIREY